MRVQEEVWLRDVSGLRDCSTVTLRQTAQKTFEQDADLEQGSRSRGELQI